jgi:hypothetical protein
MKWTNVITDNAGANEIRIEYGLPIQLNWLSAVTEPQPVEKLVVNFDPRTLEGSITPVVRQRAS